MLVASHTVPACTRLQALQEGRACTYRARQVGSSEGALGARFAASVASGLVAFVRLPHSNRWKKRLCSCQAAAGTSSRNFRLNLRGAPPARRPPKPAVSSGATDADGRSYFQMGADTLKVPFEMHARHRHQLLKRIHDALNEGEEGGLALVFQGGKENPVYDTDTVWDFKQESNFQWLFGVREPGCLAVLDAATGESLLFVPRLPQEYEAWMGPRRSLQWFAQTYEVDAALYVDEIEEELHGRGIKKLMSYQGSNRDSGLSLPKLFFDGMEGFELEESSLLFDTLAECRVVKDEDELRILQFTSDVSSDAHVAVMLALKQAQDAGVHSPEYISEANFRHEAFLRGCARVGYSCICPSGPRCAVLHYGHAAFPNAEEVKLGEMKLHDMGAEYHCYTADVTCSFPANGKFNPEQTAVYEAVWASTQQVEQTIRPGVSYRDMHRLAEKVLLEEMIKDGLFIGTVEDMQEAQLMTYFMPHGLGHCLGLDVHDVGGYKVGESRQDDPSIQQNLRCGRELLEGMVVTVEPGFYFIDYLIRRALSTPEVAKLIDAQRLEELRPVGGVRIEDNIVVTEHGCKVLTRVPRTVQEIESVMEGKMVWVAADQPFREYSGED